MKILSLLFILLPAFASAQPDAYRSRGFSLSTPAPPQPKSPVIDYPMRTIAPQDARFKAVYTAVAAALKREAQESTMMIGLSRQKQDEIIRLSLNSPKPPMCGPKLENITITQTVSDGEFLARSAWTEGGPAYHLVAPGESWHDGALVRCSLKKLPDVYRYTSVSGAILSVPSFRYEADAYANLTAEVMIDKLRSGETFIIQQGVKIEPCKPCSGAGRIPLKTGKRTGDGKTVCETCRGAGKFTVPNTLRIKW